MIACLDSGNTRIKWAIHDGRDWLAEGAVAHADVDSLAELTRRYTPTRIALANVAGPAAEAALRAALAGWTAPWLIATPSAAAHGVSNGYENPAQLGVDRWCALLGARQVTPGACLVVMAGTATTIDTLDAEGRFLGGLILPGVELMRRSLARDTAALPLADGEHAAFPRRTVDAIASGCLEAQAGAIERAHARLPTPGPCLLGGGSAPALLPLLNIPCQRIDNLVLRGLHLLST